MNDAAARIAAQRGKTVALLVLLGFVLCLVHPSVTATVWPPTALAVGALAGMEAWATKNPTSPTN